MNQYCQKKKEPVKLELTFYINDNYKTCLVLIFKNFPQKWHDNTKSEGQKIK